MTLDLVLQACLAVILACLAICTVLGTGCLCYLAGKSLYNSWKQNA